MNFNNVIVRRTIYFLVSIGLILLLAGGSYFVYAAMVARDQTVNDFQVGQVETKIKESFNENIQTIAKDQSITKTVTIENDGTINQFVRVMVLPQVGGDSQVFPLIIGKDLILENLNTAAWKDGGDGYYYYVKEAVKPKKATEALFDSVKLSSGLSDDYHEKEFKISLKVETIGSTGFIYRDAWWQGTIPADAKLKTIDDELKELIEK